MSPSPVTRHPAGRLSLCVACFIPVPALQAQTGAGAPDAVYSVGSAYDVAGSRLVVFGGFRRGGYVGDTWQWAGTRWTLITSAGPIARNAPAMAYDAARRRVVLFGGDTRATGALGDTWILDGSSWRQVAVEGPPPRSTHQMAYDSRRDRLVVFGGASGTELLGDTWEFDGTRWQRVATDGPSARTLHGLAYDSARGVTVLFGGTSRLAPDAPGHGDTWEWDGTTWRRIDIQGPSARDHVAMSYDAVRRVVVLHGGGFDDASAETWTYDGRTWRLASSAGPRRRFARLEFEPGSGSLLLYGGFDRQPSNELWRFQGGTWSRVGR